MQSLNLSYDIIKSWSLEFLDSWHTSLSGHMLLSFKSFVALSLSKGVL